MIFRVIFWLSNIKVMNSRHVIFTFQFEYHKLWNLCKISNFCLNLDVKSSSHVWIFKEKIKFEINLKKKQFWRFEVVVIQNVAASNPQIVVLLIYKWVWFHVWSPSSFLVLLVPFTLLLLLSFVLSLLFFFTLLLILPSTLLFLLFLSYWFCFFSSYYLFIFH